MRAIAIRSIRCRRTNWTPRIEVSAPPGAAAVVQSRRQSFNLSREAGRHRGGSAYHGVEQKGGSSRAGTTCPLGIHGLTHPDRDSRCLRANAKVLRWLPPHRVRPEDVELARHQGSSQSVSWVASALTSHLEQAPRVRVRVQHCIPLPARARQNARDRRVRRRS